MHEMAGPLLAHFGLLVRTRTRLLERTSVPRYLQVKFQVPKRVVRTDKEEKKNLYEI